MLELALTTSPLPRAVKASNLHILGVWGLGVRAERCGTMERFSVSGPCRCKLESDGLPTRYNKMFLIGRNIGLKTKMTSVLGLVTFSQHCDDF